MAVQLLLMLLTLVSSARTDNNIDRFKAMMARVTENNCQTSRVYLYWYCVSHAPRYVHDVTTLQQSNRTALQYAFNTAASRSYFMSMIYQWTSNFGEFSQQPGLLYIYKSVSADVLAAPHTVQTSGLFFDSNHCYANWFPSLSFNHTLPLFAALAIREQGPRAVTVKDLGTSPDSNYAQREHYPQNEVYRPLFQEWSPRISFNSPPSCTNVNARIFASDNSVQEKSFCIPKLDRPFDGRPFYDCGQSNKWLVAASVAAQETLPRYVFYTYLKHFRKVALSSVTVQFDKVDINPCPLSRGNSNPNPFGGIANCTDQQECLPVEGQGLSTSAFACCDSPGCSFDTRITPSRLSEGERAMAQADPASCQQTPPPTLVLHDFWSLDDLQILYEVQARSGLRLAHFLSDFLQNFNPNQDAENDAFWRQAFRTHGHSDETYATRADSPLRYIKMDHALTRKWIQAEVFSTVIADGRLMSAGIYFDAGQFPGSSSPVSAFAWKDVADSSASVPTSGNIADLFEQGEDFTGEDWFIQAKRKFSNPSPTLLRTFNTQYGIRTSPTGNVQSMESEYTATEYGDGSWLTPYFRCDKRQASWAVSYLAPIITKENAFAGVVKVDAVFTTNHLLG